MEKIRIFHLLNDCMLKTMPIRSNRITILQFNFRSIQFVLFLAARNFLQTGRVQVSVCKLIVSFYGILTVQLETQVAQARGTTTIKSTNHTDNQPHLHLSEFQLQSLFPRIPFLHNYTSNYPFVPYSFHGRRSHSSPSNRMLFPIPAHTHYVHARTPNHTKI